MIQHPRVRSLALSVGVAFAAMHAHADDSAAPVTKQRPTDLALSDEAEPLYALSDQCALLRANGPLNGACFGGCVGFFAGLAVSVPLAFFLVEQFTTPETGEGEGAGYALVCLAGPALGTLAGGVIGGSAAYLYEEHKDRKARTEEEAAPRGTMAW